MQNSQKPHPLPCLEQVFITFIFVRFLKHRNYFGGTQQLQKTVPKEFSKQVLKTILQQCHKRKTTHKKLGKMCRQKKNNYVLTKVVTQLLAELRDFFFFLKNLLCFVDVFHVKNKDCRMLKKLNAILVFLTAGYIRCTPKSRLKITLRKQPRKVCDCLCTQGRISIVQFIILKLVLLLASR